MSTGPHAQKAPQLTLAFSQVAAQPSSVRQKNPPPFSLRLTYEEKARLQEEASGRPLGEFIRLKLLGKKGQTPRQHRAPDVDDQKLATLLAELGRSGLASNLNQLAKAANTGTLDVSPDLTRNFEEACRDIRAMREMLMAALGFKTGKRP